MTESTDEVRSGKKRAIWCWKTPCRANSWHACSGPRLLAAACKDDWLDSVARGERIATFTIF